LTDVTSVSTRPSLVSRLLDQLVVEQEVELEVDVEEVLLVPPTLLVLTSLSRACHGTLTRTLSKLPSLVLPVLELSLIEIQETLRDSDMLISLTLNLPRKPMPLCLASL
jgi:hypothetical protein